MLVQFFSELNSLSMFASFTVIPFDCGIDESKIYLWQKGIKKKAERVLSGGTDFNVPTRYVNDKGFDGHIILTDMCAPAPINSKCSRMWITTPEHAANPYFSTREKVIAIPPRKK